MLEDEQLACALLLAPKLLVTALGLLQVAPELLMNAAHSATFLDLEAWRAERKPGVINSKLFHSRRVGLSITRWPHRRSQAKQRQEWRPSKGPAQAMAGRVQHEKRGSPIRVSIVSGDDPAVESAPKAPLRGAPHIVSPFLNKCHDKEM